MLLKASVLAVSSSGDPVVMSHRPGPSSFVIVSEAPGVVAVAVVMSR